MNKAPVNTAEPKPCRFAPLQSLARLWTSRKSLPRVKRWLYFWGIPLVGLWVLLFILTGLEAHAARTSGWRSAVDVAVTTTDPFTVHTVFAVALAISSVFIVPAVIGVAAAVVVEEQLRRMRRPAAEIEAEVADLRDELREIKSGTSAHSEK
jgi:hypothetical protein